MKFHSMRLRISLFHRRSSSYMQKNKKKLPKKYVCCCLQKTLVWCISLTTHKGEKRKRKFWNSLFCGSAIPSPVLNFCNFAQKNLFDHQIQTQLFTLKLYIEPIQKPSKISKFWVCSIRNKPKLCPKIWKNQNQI